MVRAARVRVLAALGAVLAGQRSERRARVHYQVEGRRRRTDAHVSAEVAQRVQVASQLCATERVARDQSAPTTLARWIGLHEFEARYVQGRVGRRSRVQEKHEHIRHLTDK